MFNGFTSHIEFHKYSIAQAAEKNEKKFKQAGKDVVRQE
jgi:hypothetical protein